MKVLVVGQGGREHALVWKIAQSNRVSQVYCTLGNAGIAEIARIIDIPPADIHALADFAESEGIDLTVVGPEQMLSDGIVDLFQEKGLRIFGPDKAAARLESSKIFAKELMQKENIPTAHAQVFSDLDEAITYIREQDRPLVLKVDGLAAGKGVIIASNKEEAETAARSMIEQKLFGEAGSKVIIEECLSGTEATFMVFTDGENVVAMPSSQDHKRVFDGDEGKNTGGMGAFSPSPLFTEELEHEILNTVIYPALNGLKKEGIRYKGILYAGLMISPDKKKINTLEFNCRFGDPEAEIIIPRLKSDIVDIFEAVIDEKLDKNKVQWRSEESVCVVLCSGGYPDAYKSGIPIQIEQNNENNDTIVFHAGTEKKENNTLTKGGRVLTITALGDTIAEARISCYNKIKSISFEGMHFRTDIGACH